MMYSNSACAERVIELGAENEQREVVYRSSFSVRFWLSITTALMFLLMTVSYSKLAVANEVNVHLSAAVYLQKHDHLSVNAKDSHTQSDEHEQSQTLNLMTHFSDTESVKLPQSGAFKSELGSVMNDVQSFKRYKEVERILFSHYVAEKSDPEFFSHELSNLAAYISRFPSTLQLIRALRGKDWGIRYKARSFETKITGSKMLIASVDIYFDPRSAAQLKFQRACSVKKAHCTASPADAFLHELLHVKSVVLDPLTFLSDGGMGGTLYPYNYEMDIIDEENLLYKSMTKIDEHPRPIRRDHVGKYRVASCVTCLQ